MDSPPETAFHGAVEHDGFCSHPWGLRLVRLGLGNQSGQRQGARSAAAAAVRLGRGRVGGPLARRRDALARFDPSRPHGRAQRRRPRRARQHGGARSGAGGGAAAGAADRSVAAHARWFAQPQGRARNQRRGGERGGEARRRGGGDGWIRRGDRGACRDAPPRGRGACPGAGGSARRDCRSRPARRARSRPPARGDPRPACRTGGDAAGAVRSLRSRPACIRRRS